MKNKAIKRIITAALLSTVALNLVACSTPAETESSTAEQSSTSTAASTANSDTADDSADVETITYTFRFDSDNITEEEAAKSRNGMIINGFEMLEEELGGAVNFEIEYLPKLEIDELAMQAAGGVEADLFLDEETCIGQAVKGGLVQPVDWFTELENVSGNIYQNVIDVSMYEGHLYGIPIDTAPNMLYVNKNMLKELGWTDEEIEAWPDAVMNGEWVVQDMIDTGKAAMDAGLAEYGFMMDGVDNASSFTVANAFGFDIYDMAENKLIVTDEWVDVFTLWNDLVNVSGVTPESLPSFEGTYETFFQNEALFFTDVSGFGYWQRNSNMTQEEFHAYYEENFTQALFPAVNEGDNGSAAMKVRSLFVSPQVEGEKLDYLQQAINLAYTPENTVSAMFDQGKPSVVKSAFDLAEMDEYKFLNDIAYMADYCNLRSPHPDFASGYHSYYRTQVEAIIVDKITPEEAWANMKAEIEFNIDPEELLYK